MTDAVAMARLAEIRATPSYQEGDLEAEAAYYRLHFRTTLRQPGQLEKVVSRLRANFTKEGVLKAREIEERLYQETWQPTGFSLIPQLGRLSIPTLVIHGEYDLVPNDCAAHVAQAIPGARYVLLPECGHFSYLECPELMRQAIDAFFAAS